MSAVSKKLIPASTALVRIGRLASSFSVQSAMPPKLMQPRQSRDTWVPVDPMRVNFIGPILVLEMLEVRGFGADARAGPARALQIGGSRPLAPPVSLDALVGQPEPVRRRGGLPEHVDRDAAA